MFGFGRKKKREEEEDEEKEELESRKKTPRKKKELPKPWGKKERLIVFYTLSVSVFLSAMLAASARSWKLPGLPKFSLPKISFFGEETYVIEGEATSEEVKRAENIISDFRGKTKDLSGVYGFYSIDLVSGFSFGYAETDTFQAASLMKLPVIARMYLEEESGNLDLETAYVLKDEDKISGSGSLQYKNAGYELTYRELTEQMGQQSDNTAFRIAQDLLSTRKIKETISDVGMNNTSFDNNETTPKDIGIFFQKLWNEEIVSKKNKDEMLTFLTDTIYEDHLAAGINEAVAHKYGREVHVVNDAGIAMGDKPMVIVIMTDGVVESEADEIFPELARLIYQGITK